MGRIIDRYVLRELLVPFAMGVGVFTFFLVIDRIYHLTDLVITKGVPFLLVVSLLGYMLPSFLSLTFPIALLVAVLLVGGRLNADMEVTALKASGVSPLRLLRPFVFAGVVVTLVCATLTHLRGAAGQYRLSAAAPPHPPIARRHRDQGAHLQRLLRAVHHLRAERQPLPGRAQGPHRLRRAEPGPVPHHRRARGPPPRRRGEQPHHPALPGRAGHRDRHLRRSAGALHRLQPLRHESPAGLAALRDRQVRRSRSATSRSATLRTQAAALAAQGQPVGAYYVEFHKRFALPLASLVFVLVGFPLALRGHPRGGGRGVALAVSLGIVVSYYILFTSLEGMSLRGRLPAWVGIWLADALFLAAGLILLRVTIVGLPTGWTHRALAAARRSPRARAHAPLPAPAARHRLGVGTAGARLHLPDRPVSPPGVSQVHRHRARRGHGALPRGRSPADPRPLPAHQAPARLHPPALCLPPARRALRRPAHRGAHRYRVPLPLPHPRPRARRVQGGGSEPLPGERARPPLRARPEPRRRRLPGDRRSPASMPVPTRWTG